MTASLITDTELPCRDDPDLFFAPERTHNTQQRIDEAKALCGPCLIRIACRDEGRRLRAVGIWGGEDEDERTTALGKPGTTPRAESTKANSPTKPATRRQPVECGTRPGYQRHRRRGEAACEPCRIANAQADRRLRSTGSTRKVPA